MNENATQENDTRQLFWKLVMRKPVYYRDMPTVERLSAVQIKALRALPVLDLGTPEACEDFGFETPMEFIGKVGDAFFYINTEGYTYPRYAFRLPGDPQSLKPPPYKVWVVVEKQEDPDREPEELDLPFGAVAEFADETEAMGFAHLIHEYGQNLKSKPKEPA